MYHVSKLKRFSSKVHRVTGITGPNFYNETEEIRQ